MHTIPLSDGDQGTVETIAYIRKLVDQGVKDPLINRTAIAIVRSRPAFDFTGEVRAIYEWVLKNIRFTRDIAGKETLRSAREILTVTAGDCDDINAILMPSLLGSIGHRLRLVTISSHPAAPKTFSHIYAEIFLNGRWIPLDAARRNPAFGKGPENYIRKRLWSLTDADYSDVAGLGYYTGKGMGFDWGDFTDLTANISNATANIIKTIRTPAYNLPFLNTTVAPSAAAPAPTVYQQPAAQYPTWLPYAGLGLLVLVMLRGK